CCCFGERASSTLIQFTGRAAVAQPVPKTDLLSASVVGDHGAYGLRNPPHGGRRIFAQENVQFLAESGDLAPPEAAEVLEVWGSRVSLAHASGELCPLVRGTNQPHVGAALIPVVRVRPYPAGCPAWSSLGGVQRSIVGHEPPEGSERWAF